MFTPRAVTVGTYLAGKEGSAETQVEFALSKLRRTGQPEPGDVPLLLPGMTCPARRGYGEWSMGTAVIAVAGSLLGVMLGSALSFLVQNSLAKRTRGWELEDAKRESYADFLRSVSASYANAKAGKGDPEEADLLRATTVIELIAERKIADHARLLQRKVTDVHARLRQQGSGAEETGVAEADQARRDLIKLFKVDLDIPLEPEDDHPAGRGGAGHHAGSA